jgi:2,5-furandicarboxylate decarboxylase 1
VLEGVIDTGKWIDEGPFGEFTYYYGEASVPVCTVTAVTHRTDAILLDLHPTHNEHRCLWLFPGREARLLQTLRSSVPAVEAVRIPLHGAALSAYIAIDGTAEGDARRAILLALGADNFLKHVVAVNTDIDIGDDHRVLWALNVRFQGDRDLITLTGCRGIKHDPSAVRIGTGPRPHVLTTKLGFDATTPVATPFPERADLPPDGYDIVDLGAYLPIKTVERLKRSAVHAKSLIIT